MHLQVLLRKLSRPQSLQLSELVVAREFAVRAGGFLVMRYVDRHCWLEHHVGGDGVCQA